MQKVKISIFVFLLSIQGLQVFSQTSNLESQASPSSSLADNSKKSGVVTSILPIYSIASSIMKGSGKPVLLIDNNLSAHAYTLTVSKRALLEKADMFFFVDETLEKFVKKLLPSLPKHVRTLGLFQAEGILRLRQRTGLDFEKHAKSQNNEALSPEENKAYLETAAQGFFPYDTHFWLSSQHGTEIARLIAQELSIVYPEHSQTYQENARLFSKKIRLLRGEIYENLLPLKRKPFLVFHDTTQYFEKEFKLKAAGSVVLEPEEALSIKKLRTLKKRAETTASRCLLFEPNIQEKTKKTLEAYTGLKTVELDPLGITLTQLNPEDIYFNILRKIANSFKQCLEVS